MAADLALDLAAIEQACREAAQGRSSPGQHQLAGPGRDRGHSRPPSTGLRAVQEGGGQRAIRPARVRSLPLRVMMPAQERLARDLAGFVRPARRAPRQQRGRGGGARADACRDGLVRQVSGTVRWQEAVERLVGEGVDTFVEVGPGTVPPGLVKKIDKTVRVLASRTPRPSRPRRPPCREANGVTVSGKIVLVTGASRGIGRAIAEALASAGATGGARRARRNEAAKPWTRS
jgi:[acyl-carrier-protein] S-malonyltransferase